MIQYHSFQVFLTFPRFKTSQDSDKILLLQSVTNGQPMDNAFLIFIFLFYFQVIALLLQEPCQHKNTVFQIWTFSDAISGLFILLFIALVACCLHASLDSVPSREQAMPQTGNLKPRGWLALPIQTPQTLQAVDTHLCENNPSSSTDPHISPDINKTSSASAHKLSEDVDYGLIHIFWQSRVEESITLPIIPQSKRQSNKCSRLQFKGQLISP